MVNIAQNVTGVTDYYILFPLATEGLKVSLTPVLVVQPFHSEDMNSSHTKRKFRPCAQGHSLACIFIELV